MEKKYGLIGRNISYSFSKKYFEKKFDSAYLKNYTYDIFDLQDINEAASILKMQNLFGLNVTIPYKKEIIPFLDEVDEIAESISAVNCIHISEDFLKGYNTDIYGFEKTLDLAKFPHEKALILGDGGAASAVKFVLNKRGIRFKTVSRKSMLNFDNLTEDLVSESTLILQTTPVGTFPNVTDCLKFPFHCLSKRHFVIDLIYNPEMTKFLQHSAEIGAQTINGLYMLEQQAEKAWEIWNS